MIAKSVSIAVASVFAALATAALASTAPLQPLWSSVVDIGIASALAAACALPFLKS